VVVLHEGKVLAEGRPADVSALAQGRTFIAETPRGQTAGGFQARLLDVSAILDAVPEGGRVRFLINEADADAGETTSTVAQLVNTTVVPVRPRFEDGFMVLLRKTMPSPRLLVSPSPFLSPSFPVSLSPSLGLQQPVVVVSDLVRRFGNFVAVDHVSFEVHRGEIFGLLGPNGAGKTTTFRMLCGLLPASGGMLRVAGADLRRARASARQRIGYVAQKFSLYSQLSVIENLEFFASAYNLRGERKQQRIVWAIGHFDLGRLLNLPSGHLPGGYKQRLAMATALVHEPETLFLDEPTSGADPLARREFWRRIVALAEQGVTVIVTTHFMEEAEYCDRVAIMDSGRILAQGTPAEIRLHARIDGREPTMEDAFIAIVEEARESAQAISKGAA